MEIVKEKVIAIFDESMTGKTTKVMELIFNTEKISVRDIITRRVQEEVALYNHKASGYFHGLVKPGEAETTLNGYVLKNRQLIDAGQQVKIALAAFQSNGFFMLVDNEQYERLDDEIVVANTASISFIKLTPLVGG